MKKTLIKLLSGLVIIGLNTLPASASEPLSGVFVAKQACPAFRSIRKQTNPDKVMLRVGESYTVRAKNKVAATHYLIEIPGVTSPQRWVEVSCGSVNGQQVAAPVARKQSNDYLLALSWQPGFCATHSAKTECARATNNEFSASHLALHGLWPQPRNNSYCGVSETHKSIDRRGRWDLLPALPLTTETKKELSKVMPGYASYLQRHEWIKHGTCYHKDANIYYMDSLRVTRELNQSPVSKLFASKVGSTVSLKEIRSVFAKTYGDKAAARVGLRCGRKNQVTEIWVALRGDIRGGAAVSELLQTGDSPQSNCQSGSVVAY